MTEQRFIQYRGQTVIEGWPDVIRQAQTQPTIIRKGIELERVRYGQEYDFDGNDQPCRDCAAVAGEIHVWSCAVERCPACGGQPFLCDCILDDDRALEQVKSANGSEPSVNYWADDE